MARVLTNNVSLQYTVETSIGVLPGSPVWKLLEPNNISAYGASITTVARRPIAQERGRKKGTVTNLESAVEFDADLTMQSMEEHIEGFVFAEFANKEFDLRLATLPPTATVTTDVFNIDSASTLLAGKVVWVAAAGRSLLYAKGYTTAANNGVHELAADLGATDTTVSVTSTLATETPSTNASLQVAGIRVGDSDLTFTKSGSTATLVSSADIADWSALGLLPGQFIHIGGTTNATVLQNALNASTTDDTYGYARITSISANTLNLDKLDTTLAATADNTGEGDADILFGRFLRNVAVTADADDNRYLERSYQFETVYPDLGGVGTDEYEYAIGNFANELAMSLPLTEKATATWGFIGTNADDITASRKTGASAGRSPLRTTALNTSSNIVSLTTDVVSLVSDVCFKSLTLTIRNNVTPENCLGTLGASFVNAGLFEVNLEGQMLFTNKEIVNAIKGNTTVTFAAIMANDNGAFAFDLPSATFGGGDREYPVDQSVLVNITGEAFNDPVGTIAVDFLVTAKRRPASPVTLNK
jgi:hypothetical protein